MPQTNERIVAWNQAVANSLPAGWIYIDVFPKSSVTKHDDNVHLDNAAYYNHLSGMFWGLATGLDWRPNPYVLLEVGLMRPTVPSGRCSKVNGMKAYWFSVMLLYLFTIQFRF